MPYHFNTSYFVNRTANKILEKMKTKWTISELKQFHDEISNIKNFSESYIGNVKYNVYFLGALAFLVPIICAFLSVFILKIKLSPRMRTIMSKKKYQEPLKEEVVSSKASSLQSSKKSDKADESKSVEKVEEGEKVKFEPEE